MKASEEDPVMLLLESNIWASIGLLLLYTPISKDYLYINSG